MGGSFPGSWKDVGRRSVQIGVCKTQEAAQLWMEKSLEKLPVIPGPGCHLQNFLGLNQQEFSSVPNIPVLSKCFFFGGGIKSLYLP